LLEEVFVLLTRSTTKVQFVDLGAGAVAAMSLRDLSQPAAYSMRRTGPDAASADGNIRDFASTVGFVRSSLVLPRRWPHLARVVTVRGSELVDDPSGGLNPRVLPADKPGFEHSCDGLITTNFGVVLGAQGADCPMLYLHDPVAHVIGAIHCGWKPVAQHIVRNAINGFAALGSDVSDIRAYVAPGAGDSVYKFAIDGGSQPLLEQTGRLDEFQDMLRPHPTEAGLQVFPLNAMVVRDLEAAGLGAHQITNDTRSCIEDESLHSYRRDGGPDMATSRHGLGIGVIFLTA
jgi:copper oxidase (laccase) domain-containing protein